MERGLLQRRDDYSSLYRDFRWDIPERFNIGVAVADLWAERDPDRIALINDATGETLSFGDLSAHSNAMAGGLARLGVKKGDRIAVLLPQSFETVVAHCAIYKLGAIAVPLALLFGPEALEFRLRFAGAVALVTNDLGLSSVRGMRDRLRELKHVVSVDAPGKDELAFADLLTGSPLDRPADTGPDDPGLMIFTSGTTGPPKGALHGHRVLLGHMPGFEMAYTFPPQAGDVAWTPADWAWAGGLLNLLLPALHLGIPVVFGRFERFDPASAYALMARRHVTMAFLPPTALRMLKAWGKPPMADLRLRAILSAGEQLGRETYDWAQQAFGLTVNEFYGQTECNLVLGSCAAIGATRSGATGKVVPGHRVAIIDGEGHEMPAGQIGQIAVRRPDPVMFLGYWTDQNATEAKFAGDWMLTGDQGFVDEDGFFHFFGRDDDVITSAGYRIGPGEIEDCLAAHPAVALAAAVGKPDPVRTEIVKAFVVPRDGIEPNDALADELKLWVRARLSAHEYPREIAFVEQIPLTTTGKVIRRHFREQAVAEVKAAV
jgi:acetyl-CoA synthetase